LCRTAFIPVLIGFATALTAAQSAPPRKDIPTIANAANGAVVSIIMSDKNGHPIAQGSGFVVSKDGRIVTNYHVIKSGTSAIAKLPDGAFFVVDGVLAVDKNRDIAIIKAHGTNFRTVTLGDSDKLQIGEEIVAIGNPLSLESTVSNGIISGIRNIEDDGGKFLQVTAPISPGSSGGPLFDMAGDVVGITTLYLKGGENLNFAIPINDVRRLLLVQFSKVHDLPNETEPLKAQTTDREPPSSLGTAGLNETLQWLSGASEEESGDGNTHITFESDTKYSCAVTITETRVKAGPDFWIKESFSLADIDPDDIQVEKLGQGEFKKLFQGQSSVRFHTTNYRKTITFSSKGPFYPGGTALDKPEEILTSDYTVFTNDWFAPRFAKAFRRAVELCGGKRSSF